MYNTLAPLLQRGRVVCAVVTAAVAVAIVTSTIALCFTHPTVIRGGSITVVLAVAIRVLIVSECPAASIVVLTVIACPDRVLIVLATVLAAVGRAEQLITLSVTKQLHPKEVDALCGRDVTEPVNATR